MKLRTLEDVLAADMQNDLQDSDFVRRYLAASFAEAQTQGDMGIYQLAVADVKKANPQTYSSLIEASDTEDFASLGIQKQDVDERKLVPA